MSSWTTCPCCGRMIGVRKDGCFRVHGRRGFECPGSNRTVTQLLSGLRAEAAGPEQAPAAEEPA